MKKILFLFIIICSLSFGQGWNSIVTTTINEPNLDKMDLFTNKSGNHILIRRTNGDIRYYKVNSSGTVQISTTLATGGDFPNIVGSNDKIYALYKSGNAIKVRYSTNAGVNWYSYSDRSINPYIVNGVDAVYELGQGVHLVYATRDNDPYYETHYWKLNTDNSWVDYKNVTDYGSEVGGAPTVSFSTNRVHVSYNTGANEDPNGGQGIPKTRDKYINSWQAPQQVYPNEIIFRERVHAGSSKLFDFYYQFRGSFGELYTDLYVKERTFGSSTWSASTLLKLAANSIYIVSTANTNDGKTHIVYGWSATGILYRNYNGSSWSTETTIGDGEKSPNISTVSNDLFVVWGDSYDYYVRYRQYDANPLAPQNLTFSLNPGDNHIRLQWNANTEPDLSQYEISRKVNETAWQVVTTTTNTYWVDPDWAYNDSPFDVSYRIRAKDVNNHYSSYSNIVTCHPYPMKRSDYASFDVPAEYKPVSYPNPFNPATNISYQIKDKGFVSLKVYDMLGKVVSELVNEVQDAGEYSVIFDGSNLSSGIYFCSMQAGTFTHVKKMVLAK